MKRFLFSLLAILMTVQAFAQNWRGKRNDKRVGCCIASFRPGFTTGCRTIHDNN